MNDVSDIENGINSSDALIGNFSVPSLSDRHDGVRYDVTYGFDFDTVDTVFYVILKACALNVEFCRCRA